MRTQASGCPSLRHVQKWDAGAWHGACSNIRTYASAWEGVLSKAWTAIFRTLFVPFRDMSQNERGMDSFVLFVDRPVRVLSSKAYGTRDAHGMASVRNEVHRNERKTMPEKVHSFPPASLRAIEKVLNLQKNAKHWNAASHAAALGFLAEELFTAKELENAKGERTVPADVKARRIAFHSELIAEQGWLYTSNMKKLLAASGKIPNETAAALDTYQ